MSILTRALSPTIREIRIFLSHSGEASTGTRQFIQTSYPLLKRHNPDLPVLIREVQDTPARIFARFEYGVEKHAELENLSASDVEKKVSEILTA